MSGDGVKGVRGKEDGAMTVGFEVDANVVALSGVMKVLDAGRSAGDGNLEDFVDVSRRRPVRVRCLHDAHPHLDARLFDELDDVHRRQRGDLVAIKQAEVVIRSSVVVDDPIGVSIQAAVSFALLQRDAGWCSLARLDVVGAALRIERARRLGVLLDQLER